MADIKLIIKIDEEIYNNLKTGCTQRVSDSEMIEALKNGSHLTPDVLADLLMEERIRGKLKQDISYSKDIIPDVKCILTVDIRDRRPCYCGAELREVWRESEGKEEEYDIYGDTE